MGLSPEPDIDPVEPERKPEVVDLDSYKKARQARAQPKPAPAPKSVGEPILGSRPRAGLILALVILVAVALWVLPMLG